MFSKDIRRLRPRAFYELQQTVHRKNAEKIIKSRGNNPKKEKESEGRNNSTTTGIHPGQTTSTDLPGHAVALAVVVAQVAHLAADDVHTCLSHGVLRHPLARLVVVSDDLRHGADVGASISLIVVVVVQLGVPAENLSRHRKATSRLLLAIISDVIGLLLWALRDHTANKLRAFEIRY